MDVYVCASAVEEAPIAPLEAMAQALPVVSTNVGNMSDLLPAERLFSVGDTAGMAAAVAMLAQDQPLSPTQFGLSTHNAIPAQYSIARVLTGNYVVVSAGAASAEAAVVEAQALLADGAPSVLVTVFDGPTPDDYARYRDEPEAWYAWAWRLVPAREGLPTLSLRAGAPKASTDLPHGLEVLRFFLAGEREDLLDARGVRDGAGGRLGVLAGADLLFDLGADGLEVEPHLLEHAHGDALAELDQPEQDVLGADVVVVEAVRLLAGQREHLLRARREIIHRFHGQ